MKSKLSKELYKQLSASWLFPLDTKWILVLLTFSLRKRRIKGNRHCVNFATRRQTITVSRYSAVYMNFAKRVSRSSLLISLWSVPNVERVRPWVIKGSTNCHLLCSLIKLKTFKIVACGYSREETHSVGKLEGLQGNATEKQCSVCSRSYVKKTEKIFDSV